jgi:hypothetical protein
MTNCVKEHQLSSKNLAELHYMMKKYESTAVMYFNEGDKSHLVLSSEENEDSLK